jgi:translocation and assembly module TamB
VGVAITGTLQNPRVRLFSRARHERHRQAVVAGAGPRPDGLGRTDTALLQRAAVALLAGEGRGAHRHAAAQPRPTSSRCARPTGDVRETVITLGKQLSRRWYVGYERGVNATTGTWQLIYRIAQRFTLRAQSGARTRST